MIIRTLSLTGGFIIRDGNAKGVDCGTVLIIIWFMGHMYVPPRSHNLVFSHMPGSKSITQPAAAS